MKTKRKLGLIAVLTVVLLALPAQATHEDDARIVAAAKSSYVYRTHLKDAEIKIHAKDGAVTLEGKVTNPAQRDMAQDTVESLPGVKSVDNRLKVKLANEHSDDWIVFKVKSALLFHRSVSAAKTKVSANHGVVTLTGAAATAAEKELAEEYAKDIDGVKGVMNQIKVVAEPPPRRIGEVIDDASITAQVKGALLTHRSTSALKTRATTKNGEVTVSGEAANQAEKDLVTKLVNDINGVKSVVNNMTIKQ